MRVLAEGQCIRHERYGIGVTTQSNEFRTTVDFYDHGLKKFVTSMLEAQLVDQVPPRPGPVRRTKKSSS
jgi:hypothetical protein